MKSTRVASPTTTTLAALGDGLSKVSRCFLSVAALGLTLWAATAAANGDTFHHELVVELDPPARSLRVEDRVTLPEGLAGQPVEFLLNGALRITSSSEPVVEIELGDLEPFVGNNGSSADLGLELVRYRFLAAPDGGVFSLTYEGTFDHGLSDAKEEYTRGFRETAGIVGEEGVYLAGSSFWVPTFGTELFTFGLAVEGPADWHLISQGSGTSRGDDGLARWQSEAAMEEIYLVGGRLDVYRDQAGPVEALVYLRQPDEALATKYLGATSQYLEMYRGLLGPYPWSKFALVENFWETGYGMPSFTLLGPRVIRFPFILHSSYPHEILHNWWGNSVFVDYARGNWCEGLTAYMADHLIKEQRGQGAQFRRDTLQRYSSYVLESEDFPLVDFRSRHSAATEAVGYGKTAMGFHMLRQSLGDEAFVGGLRDFYRRHRGRRASFDDLRHSFERASKEALSGRDLSRFFDDWTTRPGAPALRLSVHDVERRDGEHRIAGRIEQTQASAPWVLDVPLAIQGRGGVETTQLRLEGRTRDFELTTSDVPLALHADPAFDLFRLLDAREIPPSIGQIFGEPSILAILPSAADSAEQQQYRELMEAWRSARHAIEIKLDSEVRELPPHGVWILGRQNTWADSLFASDHELGLTRGETAVGVQQEEVPYEEHSLVVLRRHPADHSKAVGWLVVEPTAAFPGMARKLPHYGKYSYLGFQGEEPTNVVKGQWPTFDSPLVVDLRRPEEATLSLPALALEKRSALAELPPVFSRQVLADHVTFLAATERGGRGLGSPGLRASADYVAERFAAAGLEPGGDDGGWFQKIAVPGPDKQPIEARNVIAYLPAAGGDQVTESVVVSAHLDHLGRGWPDVQQGNEGKVHPGADDNASGVAVLLELAKIFAQGEAPARHLVFIAFSGEEAGRAGSRHYVEQPRFALDGVLGMINLDAVGRLGDQPIQVLGTGTADEWQHIFRGVSFVTGVASKNVPGAAEGSDQWSFIEKGVPGVQIFSGTHEDYHRPGDTADKVDVEGLVKVATFVKEAVAYLASERKEPMTVTIEGVERAAPAPSGGRRVRFGSVPEFSFAGPGVQLSGVVEGSPAERAGLREGDVLLRLDGADIANLRDFAERLRSLVPGQTVTVDLRRGDAEHTVEVTVEAR